MLKRTFALATEKVSVYAYVTGHIVVLPQRGICASSLEHARAKRLESTLHLNLG